MSRLVVLNISDNKLTDLPLSLGMCPGLSKVKKKNNNNMNNT